MNPPRRPLSRIRACLLLCVAVAGAGCASYRPRPLPASAALPTGTRALRVDTAQLALPELARHPIDLDAPLDIEAIAALAVLNDPRLRVARDAHGVAQAQAFAAGLLPDPQFSASRDVPQGGSGATSTAYNLGLGFDLGRLITRGAAEAAARADLRSIDLQILWQEWQTAADAELAYVRLVGLRERDAILERERELVATRRARDRAAVAAGDLPRTAADADLVELQALEQKLADDRAARLNQQAALDALLGLAPGARLRLAGL
ncbi:MAG: TolC family protein, partial [Burkholderiales bacterium]|nr:TolC family protein [Burkholderiales bacterium]